MSSSKTAAKPSDEAIVAEFNSMKQELQSIAQKVGELEMEVDEHKLVIDTMAPLNTDRKCFRLVGGVLVERTVGEVLPALKSNHEGIKKVIDQLLQTYKKREDEMNAFQRKYNIRITSGPGKA
ncbi:Cochaperone prefoldin complex subunit [Dimargaris xerosporica]|nr:Cochaperone prefoldin complex subunit [Dimargaris xerosporica]